MIMSKGSGTSDRPNRNRFFLTESIYKFLSAKL